VNKPRVAFFDFSCCEGCQLQVLNLENELLDLLGHIEIVNFREAMTERSDEYDIAFIEGSITRAGEIGRLRGIREKAKILVALGACADLGGINCLNIGKTWEGGRRKVYGEKAWNFDSITPRPISSEVEVDYRIPGCPINKYEFLEACKMLLLGRQPELPNHPVCVECKLRENVCLYELGRVCLGPITRAGCDPICPSFGTGCIGCRGYVDDPNRNAAHDVLSRAGLTVEQIMDEENLFNKFRLNEDRAETQLEAAG